jgi:hypothetical protein
MSVPDIPIIPDPPPEKPERCEVAITNRDLFVFGIICATDPPIPDLDILPKGLSVLDPYCCIVDYRSSHPSAATVPLTLEEYEQWLALTRTIKKRLKGSYGAR